MKQSDYPEAERLTQLEWEVEKLIDIKTPETSVVKSTIVLPAVTPLEAKEAWHKYQDLKSAIITKEDIQVIQGREFLKKSFWKKCATFFNLSVEMVSENRIIESDGSVTFETVYKATAPNGRSCSGDGACNTREKARENSVHNTRSTAHTRASNRAISNLVGGGEVSADEIIDDPVSNPTEQTKAPSYVSDPHTEYFNNPEAPSEGVFQRAEVIGVKESKNNANFMSLTLSANGRKVYWNIHSKDWVKALQAIGVHHFNEAEGQFLEIETKQNDKFLNVSKFRSIK